MTNLRVIDHVSEGICHLFSIPIEHSQLDEVHDQIVEYEQQQNNIEEGCTKQQEHKQNLR